MLRVMVQSLRRRRLTDWSLTLLTLVLLAEVVLIPPLVELGVVNRHWADASFMGLLALAAWLLFDRTVIGKIFFLLAFVSVVLRVANLTHGNAELRTADASFAAASLLALTWLTLLYTLASGRINAHRVFGAISAFLIVGLAFAQLHQLVAMHAEGAYLLLGAPADYDAIVRRLNYYSFVTLTSLGYGDITPAHPVARALTVLEALVGVLYPAALLGWLVALVSRQSAPLE
jgi:hypothetical protein